MNALALPDEADLRALVLDLQKRVRELEAVNSVLETTVTTLRRERDALRDELDGAEEPREARDFDSRRELGVSLRGGE